MTSSSRFVQMNIYFRWRSNHELFCLALILWKDENIQRTDTWWGNH